MTYLRFLGTAARMGFDAFREGRLSLSPRRWLIDLRHLHGRMRGAPPAAPAVPAVNTQALVAESRAALAAFLASGERLLLPASDRPIVSILVVLFNRADLTLRCLQSIRAHVALPYEVVLVDNGSTDETGVLLGRIDGARISRLAENGGFVAGANAAAAAARGEHLLFLNSDVELVDDAVSAVVETIAAGPEIGAVGARLVLPDGSLQEAGSIVWRDGSCLGYGRGARPGEPEYSFARDVDFVSAAFMLTTRALFEELGGFDPAYAPAYYEDVDYCVRLWKAGKRVVYDPGATVVHVEFGSSSPDRAAEMQRERREVFRARHGGWLEAQLPPGAENVLAARARRPAVSSRRVLVFDDRVPRGDAGFGFPRAADLLRALVDGGHFVTLYPTDASRSDDDARGAGLRPTIEVMSGHGPRRIREFMEARRGFYDTIVVSRPHNMELLRAKVGEPAAWASGAQVIYDAEAIAAYREAGRRRLAGARLSDADIDLMVEREVALARGVDAVIAVSEAERAAFVRHGVPASSVVVAGFALEPALTTRPFAGRHGLLFVGSFDELSPNTDAVVWFVDEVLPRVREQLAHDVRLTVVGRHAPPDVMALGARGVDLCPNVADLAPFYDRARVFVAPTRFAAGIPYKVAHAAAHGVPVVCTELLRGQLGWPDGDGLLAASTTEEFARACARLHTDERLWANVRDAAIRRVAGEYAPGRFRAAVNEVLQCRSGR